VLVLGVVRKAKAAQDLVLDVHRGRDRKAFAARRDRNEATAPTTRRSTNSMARTARHGSLLPEVHHLHDVWVTQRRTNARFVAEHRHDLASWASSGRMRLTAKRLANPRGPPRRATYTSAIPPEPKPIAEHVWPSIEPAATEAWGIVLSVIHKAASEQETPCNFPATSACARSTPASNATPVW